MPIPDYVVEMRRKVGHEMLWLPGVTAVVVDAGSVLLVRRADTGEWAPVTGILDPGEKPAVCAEREVLEEACVEASVERLVSVTVLDPVTYPNGDRAQYLDVTFRLRYVSGTAAVGDDESVEVGWYPRNQLPAMKQSMSRRVQQALEVEGDVLFQR
jgi:ADP-ribose pyrophosphatase YjhB (NUDIX family)